ncbi:hypothetical protein Tco_0786569 [Tanacetum coccineum]
MPRSQPFDPVSVRIKKRERVATPPPNGLPNLFSKRALEEDMDIGLDITVARGTINLRNFDSSRREIEAMREPI